MKSSAHKKYSWNNAVELFISTSDLLFTHAFFYSGKIKASFVAEDFRDLKTSFVLRVTLIGILATLSLLLFSCATMPKRMPLPNQSQFAANSLPQNRVDPLYIKRNTTRIVPREQGSTTGSIYADTKKPLQLFSDTAKLVAGDFVTITIPEQLQFKKPKESENEKSKQNQKNTNTSDELTQLLQKNINEEDALHQQTLEPLTSFKAQIVAKDNDGSVYLKATRSFAGQNFEGGKNSNLLLTARLPQTALNNSTISATDLSEIEISNLTDRNQVSYQTDGWDHVVSRTLAGYTPDVDQSLEILRQMQNAVRNQQNQLRNQFQSLRNEQIRFKKEQARAADLSNRQAQTESAAANNANTAAPVNTAPQLNQTPTNNASAQPSPPSAGPQ